MPEADVPAGAVSYTVAVLTIGLSDSLPLVFGLRVFQAVGNGLLTALGPGIVTTLFPQEFRGRVLGTLSMISGSLGGGALVDALGWWAIFLAGVPLCLLAIGFSGVFLRVPGRQRTLARFDLLGSVALFVSVGSLILALSLGRQNGWTELYVVALAVVSACGFTGFTIVEHRASNPILQLSLMNHRAFAPALVVSLLVFVSTFVNWFILHFFVIESLGAIAIVWGILLMVMTAANSAWAPLGG